MKLCVSTLGCAERSLEESASLCERFGIGGIELRGIGGEMDIKKIPDFRPENAAQSAAILKKYGVTPVVLGTSCKFHEPSKRAAALEEGRTAVSISASLGIPYIRVFGNNTVPDEKTAERSVVEGIGELCRFAAGTGVTVLLEVHGDFNRTGTLLPVIDGLLSAGADNFGLIWDIAHSDRAVGDNWEQFYRQTAQYVRHVHIKDHLRPSPDASRDGYELTLPGDGDIPIRDIVRRLCLDGYDGYFSLEWERRWHPELPVIETALERFTEIMGNIQ